jgi:hypothetical protein
MASSEPTSTMFHPVGSMPAGMIPADAQALALKEIAECLPFSFGSTETDEDQIDWIVSVIRELRNNPNLEVTLDGNWKTFDDPLNFKIRRGRKFTSDDLNLHLLDDFRRNWTKVRRLLREHGRDELSYQLRWPTDFNYAYFSFGVRGVLRQRRYLRPFTKALAREMSAIVSEARRPQPAAGSKSSLLCQFEFPAELVLLTTLLKQLPRWLLSLPVAWLARQVLRNVRAAPLETESGAHTCDGNLNRESVIPPEILAGVLLINRIVKKWPKNRKPLLYVHFPLADAKSPPSLIKEDYRDLARLRLPRGCAFVAGILHEDLTPDQVRMIVSWIKEFLPGVTVHISGYCGFGRCTVDATTTMLRTGAAACRAPDSESEAV